MHLARLSWGLFCCFPAGFIGCLQKSRMSNNMAKIADARKTVEQLKLEVNIDRMMVSKAAAELMAYCESHAKEDPLVTPVPSSENPFREKKIFCTIL
ncbi:guanine nucleotide-binding protein G(I)/G(S)/G(O) subunit gamma-8 isoform X1 [Sinocyclocheilus grahami]|uniref:guanine nucleotide-binding protein G(I)/G(S)/G(O) subunit gamma-8 isoform X1 n=1 Tax=Sinocyclocheilus grahami TaxID=75366 RepID=UPI0007AC610A|nr:PREDICTED: guanine nucleotide-binding protein G(I)/G(S)/G(O) subunit gamma-8 isoform X1 [Sinocyclocheilus grahami]